jgi:hypothetical protein
VCFSVSNFLTICYPLDASWTMYPPHNCHLFLILEDSDTEKSGESNMTSEDNGDGILCPPSVIAIRLYFQTVHSQNEHDRLLNELESSIIPSPSHSGPSLVKRINVPIKSKKQSETGQSHQTSLNSRIERLVENTLIGPMSNTNIHLVNNLNSEEAIKVIDHVFNNVNNNINNLKVIRENQDKSSPFHFASKLVSLLPPHEIHHFEEHTKILLDVIRDVYHTNTKTETCLEDLRAAVQKSLSDQKVNELCLIHSINMCLYGDLLSIDHQKSHGSNITFSIDGSKIESLSQRLHTVVDSSTSADGESHLYAYMNINLPLHQKVIFEETFVSQSLAGKGYISSTASPVVGIKFKSTQVYPTASLARSALCKTILKYLSFVQHNQYPHSEPGQSFIKQDPKLKQILGLERKQDYISPLTFWARRMKVTLEYNYTANGKIQTCTLVVTGLLSVEGQSENMRTFEAVGNSKKASKDSVSKVYTCMK